MNPSTPSPKSFLASLIIAICLLSTQTNATADFVGLYVAGDLAYVQSFSSDLRASGFNTIIGWTIHVHSNGDFYFNDNLIASNGSYVGDSSWGQNLAQLKGGSIKTLYLSVGAKNVPDFSAISSLIKSQGIGNTSILYTNLAAIKANLSAVDGIDLFNGDLYDQDTIVQFCSLLGSLGFKASVSVFNNLNFWVTTLQAVQQAQPDLLTGLNAQEYIDGAPDARVWEATLSVKGVQVPVYPGYWCVHSGQAGSTPAQVQAALPKDKVVGIKGAFIWNYDTMLQYQEKAADYAAAIVHGLSEEPKFLSVSN